MIVTRNEVDWIVESPSRWVLCGAPRIAVEFNGFKWRRWLGVRSVQMRSREAALQSVEKMVRSGEWKREA